MKNLSPEKTTEERLNRLLAEYGDMLRSAIARTCPRELGLEVSEIEQEVRLRLWRVLESEREISHPASYFYRVAITATLDAVRRIKAKREEQLLEAEDDEAEREIPHRLTSDPARSPDRHAQTRELVRKVEQAIALLPDNRRRAVALHLQGMGSQEIADLLDWSEPKARNLVYRGLEDLRQTLRAWGIDYEIE